MASISVNPEALANFSALLESSLGVNLSAANIHKYLRSPLFAEQILSGRVRVTGQLVENSELPSPSIHILISGGTFFAFNITNRTTMGELVSILRKEFPYSQCKTTLRSILDTLGYHLPDGIEYRTLVQHLYLRGNPPPYNCPWELALLKRVDTSKDVVPSDDGLKFNLFGDLPAELRMKIWRFHRLSYAEMIVPINSNVTQNYTLPTPTDLTTLHKEVYNFRNKYSTMYFICKEAFSIATENMSSVTLKWKKYSNRHFLREFKFQHNDIVYFNYFDAIVKQDIAVAISVGLHRLAIREELVLWAYDFNQRDRPIKLVAAIAKFKELKELWIIDELPNERRIVVQQDTLFAEGPLTDTRIYDNLANSFAEYKDKVDADWEKPEVRPAKIQSFTKKQFMDPSHTDLYF